MDLSNPYGAVSSPYGTVEPMAAPVRAEPAAIRIELSDDVLQAQKTGRSKIAILALVTAVIGGVLGYGLGGGAERAKGTEAALTGAKELASDVEKANAKIEELADTLKAAREKLGKAQFPEEEVKKLGELNIPFQGTNLAGKGIGRFNSEVLNMLIDFSSASVEANDQKEKIQNVLNGNKKVGDRHWFADGAGRFDAACPHAVSCFE
jgi:outer membrane murein-binding lipoprotein Lpp